MTRTYLMGLALSAALLTPFAAKAADGSAVAPSPSTGSPAPSNQAAGSVGDQSGSVDQNTVEQVTGLNNQIVILQSKLKIAQLMSQIRDANKTDTTGAPTVATAPVSSPVAMTTPPPPIIQSPQAPAPAQPKPLPQVLSISGTDKRLSATLLTSSGSEVIAHDGLLLADGSTVSSITDSGVTVRQNGQSVMLAFVGDDTDAASTKPAPTPVVPIELQPTQNSPSFQGGYPVPLQIPSVPPAPPAAPSLQLPQISAPTPPGGSGK